MLRKECGKGKEKFDERLTKRRRTRGGGGGGSGGGRKRWWRRDGGKTGRERDEKDVDGEAEDDDLSVR